MNNTENDLQDAVAKLARKRLIRTTQLDDGGRHVRTHVEEHPPLLLLLAEGTGTARGSKRVKPEQRIPIDADALELLARIRDQLREWSIDAHLRWDSSGDWSQQLVAALERWHAAYVWAIRAGHVPEPEAAYTLRVVLSWVDAIERKYDPHETREWTDACPATVIDLAEPSGRRRCNARRVAVDGVVRFAILVDVTDATATCAACGTSWVGYERLKELRYLTNLWNLDQEMRAAEQRVIDEASTGPIGVIA